MRTAAYPSEDHFTWRLSVEAAGSRAQTGPRKGHISTRGQGGSSRSGASQVPQSESQGLVEAASLQVWRLVPTPLLRIRRRYAEVVFTYLPWSAGPAPGVSYLAVTQRNGVYAVPSVRCVPPQRLVLSHHHHQSAWLWCGVLPFPPKTAPRKGKHAKRAALPSHSSSWGASALAPDNGSPPQRLYDHREARNNTNAPNP